MNVYHGSPKKFNIAKPAFTKRVHLVKNKMVIDYEGISLHVTPYKWIALSYMMRKRVSYLCNGKTKYFTVGAPVKKKDSDYRNKIIYIHGKRSLKYSLDKIYSGGGFLYTFKKSKFKRVKGLGENELISFDAQVPDKIEYVNDPVKEMTKLGVNFVFVNEAESIN